MRFIVLLLLLSSCNLAIAECKKYQASAYNGIFSGHYLCDYADGDYGLDCVEKDDHSKRHWKVIWNSATVELSILDKCVEI